MTSLVGVFFVFDAGYVRAMANEKGFIPSEFRNQVIFLILSLGVTTAASRFRPDFWRRFAIPIWTTIFVMVVAVEYIGVTQNGARRWLGVGQASLQPAEFAKLGATLYLSAVFATRKAWPQNMPKRTVAQWIDTVAPIKLRRAFPAIWVFGAAFFIEKEPDLGTAAVVIATAVAMFGPGGVTLKSRLATIAILVLGAGIMVKKEPYRMERITNHVHRWEARNADDVGFQTIQSEAAMASGGVFGVGIGNGRAKHILPATTTDFVMATIGEETGLFGSLCVLGLIGAIVARLVYLANRLEDRFGSLVLVGVASWIGIQACVNVMMANGFLPAIGIPLPFISSGGSSLIALWLALGVCQSISAPRPKPATTEEEAVASDRDRWGNGRAHLSRA